MSFNLYTSGRCFDPEAPDPAEQGGSGKAGESAGRGGPGKPGSARSLGESRLQEEETRRAAAQPGVEGEASAASIISQAHGPSSSRPTASSETRRGGRPASYEVSGEPVDLPLKPPPGYVPPPPDPALYGSFSSSQSISKMEYVYSGVYLTFVVPNYTAGDSEVLALRGQIPSLRDLSLRPAKSCGGRYTSWAALARPELVADADSWVATADISRDLAALSSASARELRLVVVRTSSLGIRTTVREDYNVIELPDLSSLASHVSLQPGSPGNLVAPSPAEPSGMAAGADRLSVPLSITMTMDWAPDKSTHWRTAALRTILEARLDKTPSAFAGGEFVSRIIQPRSHIPKTTYLRALARASYSGVPRVPEGVGPDQFALDPDIRVPVLFRVMLPFCEPGDRVFVIGNVPVLSSWSSDVRAGLELRHVGGRLYEASAAVGLAVSQLAALEFKYALLRGGETFYEAGSNRRLVWLESTGLTHCPLAEFGARAIVAGGFFRYPGDFKPRFSGVALPLSAARSSRSCGIGDFGDLKLLADACVSAGMSLLQLLPLNDTIKGDPAASVADQRETERRREGLAELGRRKTAEEPAKREANSPSSASFLAPSGVSGASGLSGLSGASSEFSAALACPTPPAPSTTIQPCRAGCGGSNPYNSVSAFALHPAYISLDELLGEAGKAMFPCLAISTADREEISTLVASLRTSLERPGSVVMPYGLAVAGKWNILVKIYNAAIRASGFSALRQELDKWVLANPTVGYWIFPYAVYRYCCTVCDTDLPDRWDSSERGKQCLQGIIEASRQIRRAAGSGNAETGEKRSLSDAARALVGALELYVVETPSAKAKPAVSLQRPSEVEAPAPESTLAIPPALEGTYFHVFLQYIAYGQLARASAYCRERGVALKADLQIGIGRGSADVWFWPEVFNLQTSTGAPPDAYSSLGQNWGTPTFNWEAMAAGDRSDPLRPSEPYAWMRARIRNIALFFDALRIDHILGWFRIWELSSSAPGNIGLAGRFYPCFPVRWEWAYRYVDPGSPIPWCRSREALRARLEEPQLSFFQAHAACSAGGADGEALCAFLVQLGLLEKGRDGYALVLSETEAVERIARAAKSRDITPAYAELAIQNYVRLAHNCVLLADRQNPEETCHPFFANREAATEMPSLTFLGHNDLQRDARTWSREYFSTWHGDIWAETAHARFRGALSGCDMLICGEDLGFLHPCVAGVLREEGILGLRVQRMPRNPAVAFSRFDDPVEYSYDTVASPSTHDNPPLRLWWQEDPSVARTYWSSVLREDGPAPLHMGPELLGSIVGGAMSSGSMFCVVGIQDVLDSSPVSAHNGNLARTRINDPARPEVSWKYRMPLLLDGLAVPSAFQALRVLAAAGGRVH